MSVKVFARYLGLSTLLLIVIGCTKEASQRFMAADVHSSDASVAAGTPAVSSALTTSATSLLELHFINVGQGDCTLVKCPNGQAILVDCGSIKDGDAGQVRDYLLGQLDVDNPRIDLLVVSHPDQDHYNFIPDVLFDVETDKDQAHDIMDLHLAQTSIKIKFGTDVVGDFEQVGNAYFNNITITASTADYIKYSYEITGTGAYTNLAHV